MSGRDAKKIADLEHALGSVTISPDGSTIAFVKLEAAYGGREIWLTGSQGESPHRILAADDQASIYDLAWSPGGKRLAYRYARRASDRTDMSLQSCDVNGENQTTILKENRLSSLIWLPPGRLIYVRVRERGAAESDDLWEMQVDDQTGRPHGKPRRLTDWSGFAIDHFSATKDGKQLAFLKSNEHSSVFVGDLTGSRGRLVNTRQLTNDDNINIALTWTADSRDVVFSSKRTATRTIYRQDRDKGGVPQLLTVAPEMNFYVARISPDRAWMIVEGEQKGSRKLALYRVAMSGGVPQMLFPLDGFGQFWCADNTANFCVIGLQDPGKNDLVVSSFGLQGMVRKEVMRIALEKGSDALLDYSWQLSPDGSRIAVLKRHDKQIQILRIDKGEPKTVMVKGRSDLTDIDWAVDSQNLFVAALEPSGATLLHVDLDGNAQTVWHQPQPTWIRGFPSPDGRHLAIMGSTSEANVWIISNF